MSERFNHMRLRTPAACLGFPRVMELLEQASQLAGTATSEADEIEVQKIYHEVLRIKMKNHLMADYASFERGDRMLDAIRKLPEGYSLQELQRACARAI